MQINVCLMSRGMGSVVNDAMGFIVLILVVIIGIFLIVTVMSVLSKVPT